MSTGFKVVSEEIVEAPAGDSLKKEQGKDTSAAMDIILLSLKALSQRAVVALSVCFTGLALASAFWLWLSVLPNPNALQLVGLALYALFVLAVEVIRRR